MSLVRSGVASIAWYSRVHRTAAITGQLHSAAAICIADRREQPGRHEVEVRDAERRLSRG